MNRKAIVLILLLTTSIFNGFCQIIPPEGVLNDPEFLDSFDMGHEEISASIKMSLSNLNLFEYSHALPELYPLLESGEISEYSWNKFIDSLEQVVIIHQNDSMVPYWAVDYVGLIPIQARFFIATIKRNHLLNEKYPKAFAILERNTKPMSNLGYNPNEYDSLLVLSEVVGETNFWYFFQVEGCPYVKEVISKDQYRVQFFRAITSSMDMTSTFKVPLQLQKRKWYSLKKRLEKCSDPLCREASEAMKSISIMIEDKNFDYFKEGLVEGIDRNKMKEF